MRLSLNWEISLLRPMQGQCHFCLHSLSRAPHVLKFVLEVLEITKNSELKGEVNLVLNEDFGNFIQISLDFVIFPLELVDLVEDDGKCNCGEEKNDQEWNHAYDDLCDHSNEVSCGLVNSQLGNTSNKEK